MLDTLTSRECTEILAFAEIEPLARDRADLRAAMTALVAARAGGAKGARLADFLLDTDPKDPAAEQDQAEMDRQMEKVAALFDAADRTKQPKALPEPQKDDEKRGDRYL